MWNTGWRLFLKSPHSAVTCTALQQSKGAGAFKAGTFISNQTYDVTIFVWPVLCQVTTVKWLCLEDPPPPKKKTSLELLCKTALCVTLVFLLYCTFLWQYPAKQNLLGLIKFYFIFFSVIFFILKQVAIYFSCLGECCNTDLLWSSRNVLWTTKLLIGTLVSR